MKKFFQQCYEDRPAPLQRYFQPFGLILIAIIGWVFTQDIDKYADILFWDEANYMQSGKAMFDKINKGWGPTYAVWFKFLSLFENDSIRLYYLNYRLMAILPAMALFILLLQSNIRRWAALWIALLFIFADINLPIWPKVSHYSIFVMLTGIILMRRIKIHGLKLAFMAYVVLFLAYSRPEVFLTYVAILVIWIFVIFTDRASRAVLPFMVSFLAIIGTILIQLKIGNPMFTFQGSRSAVAFAQHFMLNYYQWNGIDQDFWITWMPYYLKEFGDSQSVMEAYRHNSPLLTQHITSNIQQYVSEGYRLFTDAMLPEKLIQIPFKARIILLTLGGAASILLMGKATYIKTLSDNLRRNILVLIILLLFVAPSVAACIVIYPREHYMLLQLPIVLLIVSIFFFSRASESVQQSYRAWVIGGALSIFCFVKMPSLNQYDFFDLWRKENSLANLNAIEKLRAYNFSIPVRLLENEGGLNLFLTDNYSWVRGFSKTIPFLDYIKKEQVQVIYVTPSLTGHFNMKNDTTWLKFVANPDDYGFVRVNTGNAKPYLLIEKDLLQTAKR